jgi:hypothetical protein
VAGLLVAVLAPAAATSYSDPSARRVGEASGAAPVLSAAAWPTTTLGGLNLGVFELALGAVTCAIQSGDVVDPATLTVIDYSRPSSERRLWVFDLPGRALLFKELVAHGRESGENLASAFSNEHESHQSSLGLFRTEDAYDGRNGYSLRLHGLDEGYNDQAYARAIVMHGAPYVSEKFARKQGRIGRSHGCPALSVDIAREVIDTVKGGHGLVFAYYPDPAWLAASKYIRACDAAVPVPSLSASR